MDLIDLDDTRRLRREDAAQLLHELANSIAQHNSVEFQRNGKQITVRVPDEVDLKIEVELGDDGNELEIELTW